MIAVMTPQRVGLAVQGRARITMLAFRCVAAVRTHENRCVTASIEENQNLLAVVECVLDGEAGGLREAIFGSVASRVDKF